LQVGPDRLSQRLVVVVVTVLRIPGCFTIFFHGQENVELEGDEFALKVDTFVSL
jgi:hypothetical protein